MLHGRNATREWLVGTPCMNSSYDLSRPEDVLKAFWDELARCRRLYLESDLTVAMSPSTIAALNQYKTAFEQYSTRQNWPHRQAGTWCGLTPDVGRPEERVLEVVHDSKKQVTIRTERAQGDLETRYILTRKDGRWFIDKITGPIPAASGCT